MALRTLEGYTIGVTADRRRDEQAAMLDRRGARVVHGPSISTSTLTDEPALGAATRRLLARPPEIAVLTTGIGVRSWFAAAAAAGVEDALRRALRRSTVIARGPKAAGAAITAGLEVAWRAPSERSTEIAAHLTASAVRGVRVAVQCDGAAAPFLGDLLRAAGADVVDVSAYRWVRPCDDQPARRLVAAACAGTLDALTFTSSPAVDNLLHIAGGRRQDLVAACNGGVQVVCVGPVCQEAAIRAGIVAPAAPAVGRLGAMVRVVEDVLAGRRRVLGLAGAEVVLQGTAVEVDGVRRTLRERERALLDALVAADGAVVGKEALRQRVWGGAADAHTVEVTVARLRMGLGPAGQGIRTVPRRGYRLEASAGAGSDAGAAGSPAVPVAPTTGRRRRPPPTQA